MPRQRDPLSVYYDDFAQRFLAVLAGDLYRWHTATVRSPAGDPVDARGLSRHERAVTRSLYYTLNSTGAEGPQGGRWIKNPDWSLQVGGWSAPGYEGGVLGRIFGYGNRTRVLTARMVGGLTAVNYVDQATAYTLNEAEQSQALAL